MSRFEQSVWAYRALVQGEQNDADNPKKSRQPAGAKRRRKASR